MATDRSFENIQSMAQDLALRVFMRAKELSRSGGVDLEQNPEILGMILYVAALKDVAGQIEEQAKKSPPLQKAINNLRHF